MAKPSEKTLVKTQARREHLVNECVSEAKRFSQLSEDIAPAGQGQASYSQLTVSALLYRVAHFLEAAKTLPATTDQLSTLFTKAKNEMEVDTQVTLSPEILHTAKAAAERAYSMAERRLAQPPARKIRFFRAAANHPR